MTIEIGETRITVAKEIILVQHGYGTTNIVWNWDMMIFRITQILPWPLDVWLKRWHLKQQEGWFEREKERCPGFKAFWTEMHKDTLNRILIDAEAESPSDNIKYEEYRKKKIENKKAEIRECENELTRLKEQIRIEQANRPPEQIIQIVPGLRVIKNPRRRRRSTETP